MNRGTGVCYQGVLKAAWKWCVLRFCQKQMNVLEEWTVSRRGFQIVGVAEQKE